jgi:hypothetical protein
MNLNVFSIYKFNALQRDLFPLALALFTVRYGIAISIMTLVACAEWSDSNGAGMMLSGALLSDVVNNGFLGFENKILYQSAFSSLNLFFS